MGIFWFSSNKKFIENCEDVTHNNIPVDIAELPRRRSWLKESGGWPVSKSRSRGVKEYLWRAFGIKALNSTKHLRLLVELMLYIMGSRQKNWYFLGLSLKQGGVGARSLWIQSILGLTGRGGGFQSPKPKSNIQSSKCAYGGEGVTRLGLSKKIPIFWTASLNIRVSTLNSLSCISTFITTVSL